jgi:hypothetical protein
MSPADAVRIVRKDSLRIRHDSGKISLSIDFVLMSTQGLQGVLMGMCRWDLIEVARHSIFGSPTQTSKL